MGYTVPTGKPGVQPTTYTAQPREIFWGQAEHAQYLPFPATIDGTLSGNPSNAPYTWLLFAGTLLGQVTATKKFANSILGLTTQAVAGGQTTLNTDVNTAAYLSSRIGTSGTFNLTGPSYPGGPNSGVRSQLVTYSAVNLTTGAITITATNVPTVVGVNQIDALVVVDNTGVGGFTLTVEGVTTGTITYSATAATLVANINTALNTAFGTGEIVASGASLAAIILTFSGPAYTNRLVGAVESTVVTNAGGTTYTINGLGTVGLPVLAPITTPGSVPYQLAPVNAIYPFIFVDNTGVGTFTITVEGVTTAAITYSATVGTLKTNIQNALNTTFGTDAFAVTGAALASVVITAQTGSAFGGRPIASVASTVVVNAGGTTYTINGIGTVGAVTPSIATTAGVAGIPFVGGSGDYIAGSLIQPTDGSQVVKTVITDIYGVKIIDALNTTRVDVFDPALWGGGSVINSDYLVSYPTDPALQQYVKSSIRAFLGWAIFSDDYV